jgi:hypothetical protein
MGVGKNEAFDLSIDERLKKKKRIFFLVVLVSAKQAEVDKQRPGEDRQSFGSRVRVDITKLDFGVLAGGHMEKTAEQLQMVNEEVMESKKILQDIYNDLIAVTGQLNPLFKEQISGIRTARMSTVTEVQSALASLREIRKFFLEDDYEKEMKRLKEFIGLCNELKRLKEDGTIDAICDTTIKLAVGGII